MRLLSLNARTALDQRGSEEVEVLLILIEHPDLEAPLRMSTDPTERISLEPVMYGTYSTWETDDNSPFYFILMEALVPDEQDDAPAQASLILQMLDSDIGEVLTSTTEQATVSMAVVLASSPNVVEAEWLGLRMVNAEIDSGQAQLRFSTEPIYEEPFPADRLTKERFPGLHR